MVTGSLRRWLGGTRLGQAAAYEQALQQPHVREFDITGRPMKGWVLVGAEGVEDDKQLQDWINQTSEFVATLPGK
jgi:hypothetical protein